MRADTVTEPTKESGAPECRETSGWRFFHALGPFQNVASRSGIWDLDLKVGDIKRNSFWMNTLHGKKCDLRLSADL